MEDALKFLLVAGILIYGLVKKARKSSRGTAFPDTDAQGMPVPDATNPLPENWGQPPHAAPAARPAAPQPKRPKSKPFIPPGYRETGTHTAPATPPPPGQPAAGTVRPERETAAEPDPHLLEDVRKGIIWAEILHQKY